VYLMLHGGALSREVLRAAYGMWRQGAGDATVNNGFARLAAGAARKGCNFAKFILSTNARKNERALEKMLGRHL